MTRITTTRTGKMCLECSRVIPPGGAVKVTTVFNDYRITHEYRCVECMKRKDGSLIAHNTANPKITKFNINDILYEG